SVISNDSATTRHLPDGTAARIVLGPDPRFGVQAPFEVTFQVSTPGGLAATVTKRRTSELSDAGDLLSLVSWNETTSVNGRTFSTAYDSSTRTFTNVTPMGRRSTWVIDSVGHPLLIQPPGLLPIALSYDGEGRLVTRTEGLGTEARTTT